LTTREIEIEQPDDQFYRQLIGGRGVIAWYLLNEMPSGADPLGPDNLLVFAPGVITGTNLSGQGRNGVGAKSPLTGGFGNAEAGGYWGAELKRAGYDAIVVRGIADSPVYLWVTPEGAEIRDARHLWGLTVGDAEDALWAELGDDRVRTALIGPGGENLVRYACVVNDRTHFAGRTGLGAVMGSKRLKGVAVRAEHGPGQMRVADPEGIRAIARWMGSNLDLVRGLHDTGTAGGVRYLSKTGGLPTYNFQAGSMPTHEKIDGRTMRDTILVKRDTCDSCVVRCKRVVEASEPWKVDRRYGGPEYETVAALGSLNGVDNLIAVAKANELCAAYGLDTISTGAVIAFALEAFDRGVLTTAEADGLELRWGDPEVVLTLLERIVRREGVGDLLAEGVARAARQLGPAAEDFALHVKGQEVPMHDPRIKHSLGVGYAVSPTGADHMHNMHDTMYTKEGQALKDIRAFSDFRPLPFDDLSEEKMRLFHVHVNWRHFLDCAVICHFLPYSPAQMVEMVNAATGWDTDLEELLMVGVRAATMARLFNLREGFGAEDDVLPRRFFEKYMRQTEGDGVPLDPAAFEAARRMYYRNMGWDEEGVPTPQQLEELGIELRKK
jgi:aldehyde:ferredoxin oxidoreductase